MWPRKTALVAVFWTLYFLANLPDGAHSTGVFELQIRSFTNELGLAADGACCEGIRHHGICSQTCRTFFKVCLAHYQADIATNPQPRCTFANYSTPVLGGNTMNFTILSGLSVPAARQNSFNYTVKEFQWPGDFSLIIEAWHDTRLDKPARVLISRVATIRTAISGAAWTEHTETFVNTQIKYAFRFQCDGNYYGPNCAVLCRPRDDEFGHYSCSHNGTKVCLAGWSGEYCEDAVCLSGCDPHNGYCDQPNECSCTLGWQGKYCDKCIPLDGCSHGTCHKPGQCNCEEGWGGLLCNQDLNFCTHHSPCKNEGVCTNTGQGSYTCICKAGFVGENCEIEVDDCQDTPCHHGGICQDIGDGYQCECPQGFYGRRCEKEAVSCLVNPCQHGGKCVEQGDSYYCICAAGYEDYNCATEVNECDDSPCQHGGKCLDQLNGYRCVCPPGYSGAECQNNDDDCADNPCGVHGYCIDMVNDYRCQCKAGYVGSLCQENVDDCEMRPCANGGSCTDLVNDFQCACAPGWVGKDCSLAVDECSDNPCLNGGICEDMLADYACACLEGFWGKNCHMYDGMPVVDDTNSQTQQSPTSQATWSTGSSAGVALDGNKAGQDAGVVEEEDDGGLSMAQLLVIVCLGVGIPLILIIIAVTILLCRKRSWMSHQGQHSTQQNLENLEKERRHYINNINKSSNTLSSNLSSPTGESSIFTMLPSSASNSSSIKMNNEEQQDINKLKAKHMILAGDCGISATKSNYSKSSKDIHIPDDDGGGGSSLLKQQTNHNSYSHQDVVAITHKEQKLKSSPSPLTITNIPPSSSVPSSHGSGCAPPSRAGDSSDKDNDKSYRKLDVDSLHADTRRPLSEYQRVSHGSHPRSGVTTVNPPVVPLTSNSRSTSRDNTPVSDIYSTSGTVFISGGYNNTLSSLTPQQQQLLQQQLQRHSRYDEDFLATEV